MDAHHYKLSAGHTYWSWKYGIASYREGKKPFNIHIRWKRTPGFFIYLNGKRFSWFKTPRKSRAYGK